MEILIVLLAVAVLAAVGHGIWTLVAFVVRAMFGFGSDREARIRCPHCQQSTPLVARRCAACGLLLDVVSAQREDRQATQRHVSRLVQAGLLTAEDRARIERALELHHTVANPIPRPELTSDLLAGLQTIGRDAAAASQAARPGPQAATGTITSATAPVPRVPMPKVSSPPELVEVEPELVEVEVVDEVATILGQRSSVSTSATLSTPAARSRDTFGKRDPAGKAKEEATDQPRAEEPSKSERRPRRSWTEILAAFMEDRNIRWGEIVGGLLIVCSSIALVISLWGTLHQIPYFQFFVLGGLTVSLFGAGLYTHHRWKLESSSRGVLLIATLLTPLSFTAMAGAARGGWTPFSLALQVVSLAVLGWLLHRAGKVLVGRQAGWLCLGVLAISALLLLVPRDPTNGQFARLAGAVVCIQLVTLAGRARSSRDGLEATADHGLAWLLSVVFAVGTALGLLVLRSSDTVEALHRLASWLALASAATAAASLEIVRRLDAGPDRGLARTSNTGIAIAGMLGMLAALVCAWPEPWLIIIVGLVNFVALECFTWRYRFATCGALAVASLTVAIVPGVQILAGATPAIGEPASSAMLLRAAVSESMATGLIGVFTAALLSGGWLKRAGRLQEGMVHDLAAAAVMIGSASLAAWQVWAQGAATPHSLLVFASVGAGCMILALRLRWRAFAYVGSVGLAAALVLAVELANVQVSAVTAGLLLHATLVTLFCLVQGQRSARTSAGLIQRTETSWERYVVGPLWDSVDVVSCVALVSIVYPSLSPVSVATVLLLWLGGVWLVRAVAIRRADWFAAGQAAMAIATITGVYAWIDPVSDAWSPWRQWLQVDVLAAMGCGLAALAVVWSIVRVSLRGRPAAEEILHPAGGALDQWMQRALTAALFATVAAWLATGIAAQVSFGTTNVQVTTQLAMSRTWWVAAGLAVAFLIRLWDRIDVVGLVAGWMILVALAGLTVIQVGVASAAGVGVAIAATWFLTSAIWWLRDPMARAFRRGGCRSTFALSDIRPWMSVGAGVAIASVSMLTLVKLYVISSAAGVATAATGWIAATYANLQTAGPLWLLAVTLVGTALRERSSRYAFFAGLCMKVGVAAVVAGQALTGSGRMATLDWLVMLQWVTVVAGGWAIAWALTSANLRLPPDKSASRENAWLNLEYHIGQVGNLLSLGSGLAILALMVDGRSDWVALCGAPLGWVALLATIAAGVLCARAERHGLRVGAAGLAGMAVLGLMACSVHLYLPGTAWAYRTLMTSWALFAASIVGASWFVLERKGSSIHDLAALRLVQGASSWVKVAGALAVLLALKAAFLHEDRWWSAGTIAVAACGFATLAVWQHRDHWAFVAGLGFNLAASLVVWQLHLDNRLSSWNLMLPLTQWNALAAGAAGCLWLAAGRRFYPGRPARVGDSPALALQLAWAGGLALVGTLAPLAVRVVFPHDPAWELMRLACATPAWLGCLAVGAFATGCVWTRRAGPAAIVVVPTLLGLTTLTAYAWSSSENWGWHTLELATFLWSAVTALLAIVSVVPATWPWRFLAGKLRTAIEPGRVFDPTTAVGSIAAISAAVGAVGLVCATNGLGGPWTRSGGLFVCALSMAVASIAVSRYWARHASTLTAACAAALAWWPVPWAEFWPELCLAVATALATWAIGWTSYRLFSEARKLTTDVRLFWLELVATRAALTLVATAAAATVINVFVPQGMMLPPWLPTCACALTGIACTLGLTRPASARPWAELYALGWTVMALVLAGFDLEPSYWVWHATWAAAAYLLAAALTSGLSLSPVNVVASDSPHAEPHAARTQIGFMMAQFAGLCLVAIAGLWTTCEFATLGERVLGALSITAGLGTCHVMSRTSLAGWRQVWRLAAVLVGSAAAIALGWAIVGPSPELLTLSRLIVILVVVSGGLLGGSILATGDTQSLTDWPQLWRWIVAVAAPLSALLLTWILWQEAKWMPPLRLPHPVGPWGVAAVCLALLAFLANLLTLAVQPRPDPWGLSNRGRQAYVYAAQIMILAIVLHFRVTIPRLFEIGLLERYWTLIVMAVAFTGAGLSAWFERLRRDVLSEPLAAMALWAPMIPVFGHWMYPPTQIAYTMLLLLVSGFYALQAATRRSTLCALFAVAVGNTGLWFVWRDLDIEFLRHPQIWLIPVGLTILAAGHANRGHLTPQQSAAARYLGLAIVYVSSTADIVMARLGHRPGLGLVLVLMALSVGGVLTGIVMRVRSFLFLGLAFLLVDLGLVIHYAAHDLGQTWVIWLAGIFAGTAILAVFAVFEKRKNDVRLALDRLRQWQ